MDLVRSLCILSGGAFLNQIGGWDILLTRILVPVHEYVCFDLSDAVFVVHSCLFWQRFHIAWTFLVLAIKLMLNQIHLFMQRQGTPFVQQRQSHYSGSRRYSGKWTPPKPCALGSVCARFGLAQMGSIPIHGIF